MNEAHEEFQGMMVNRTYDEIQVGETATLVRTLTHADIEAFAAVSGDNNPAHLDPVYAQGTRFKTVIAHGMWGGALISAVLGTRFPGPGTIYLGQTLNFSRPVRVGDTVTVHVTAKEKKEHNRQVVLDCQVVNQKGETVLSGEATVMAPADKIEIKATAAPTITLSDPAARLNELLSKGAHLPPVRTAVVHPCDLESIQGALEAAERGLIIPVLVGPIARMRMAAEQAGLSLEGVELVDTEHSHASADRSVQLAATGKVQALMKGSLHTDELLHAILSEPTMRTGRRLSHVFRFDIPMYPKPLLITDAAINIHPNLMDKVDIVQNAIDFAQVLGVFQPKVAILSAVETVNPAIPSTLEAAALCKMADRGQITHALLDGPLAFDNAISPHAVEVKHIKSAVAGDADILLVPDLESGNMLSKQLEYLAGASGSGVVLGARVPIALTSRSDGAEVRMASALLVKLLAAAQLLYPSRR